MDSVLDFVSRFLATPHVKLWTGAFVLGFVCEIFLTAERNQPWRLKVLNVAHALVYALVLFVCSPFLFGIISALANTAGLAHIRLPFFQSENLGIQIAGTLLYFALLDFFYYWWHRAQHVVPVLWDQHAIHHSETALNVTSATRHHWSEFAFQAFVISLPLLVLVDLTPTNHVVLATVFGLWQFFLHMNIRLSFGPLAWLFAGPQVHRIHHSILEEHRDRNFAAYVPLWDVVFGTYWHPRRDEYPPTGIVGERHEHLLTLSFSPFIKWGRRLLGLFPTRKRAPETS